jgi:BirA family transcriptional regulator, biotin operon repressor / biotin---[acetyl-CoA-carboxylase] ligase
VELSADLSPEALAEAMPGRPARSYPALLSTNAEAGAWARAGAPGGAVVVADYQAAPRGRGGLPWSCRPGRDLGFSLVLRPSLAPDDEGWVFVAAAVAVADVLGEDTEIAWPDHVRRGGRVVADVAGHAGLGGGGVAWAVLDMLVHDAQAPRGPLLARLAAAAEAVQEPDGEVLARYRERCATLGTEVVAHLVPTWPDGVRISGTASTVLQDGALVVEEAPPGRRVAVRPQHLARIVSGGEPAAG